MSHVEFMADSRINIDTVFIDPQTMLREHRFFTQGHFDEMVYSVCTYKTVLFKAGASQFLVSGMSRASSEPVCAMVARYL